MRNNHEVSVYDNIIAKSQSGVKNTQKKPVQNHYERSTSVKRNATPKRNTNAPSAQKNQPLLNEGDRLYNEILQKLNKELLLKNQI